MKPKVNQQKVNIFISYSQQNPELRQSVIGKLQDIKNFEVKYDSEMDKGDPEFHKTISAMINWSHVVVAIITNNWLDSHEARDELVRAHERRKIIIALVKNDEKTNLGSIPHFLVDNNQIRFGPHGPLDFDNALAALIKAISKITNEKWKQEIYRGVRELGDVVTENKNAPIYKQAYSVSTFEEAKKEISRMLQSDEFALDIGYERNFLTTASPIFETAKRILAISIASISTFWSDSRYTHLAQNYLSKQGGKNKEIIRLFIFESPEEMNKFKNILHANYYIYGNWGGVFACSKETYKFFLGEIREDKYYKDIFDEDFGLLSFDHPTGDIHVEAILDSSKLMLKQIDMERVTSAPSQIFISMFEELKKINEGKFHKEFRIIRWHPPLIDDYELYSDILNKLFENKEGGPVLHLVVIRNIEDKTKIKDILLELKYYFIKPEIKAQLNLSDVWLYDKIDPLAHDGRFMGNIRISRDYDFILGFEFSDEKSLVQYYSHRIHSTERESLYCAINPEVIPLYDQCKKMGSEQKTAMKNIYNQIEDLMERYITRIDLRDQEPIESIVRRPGLPFGKYKS